MRCSVHNIFKILFTLFIVYSGTESVWYSCSKIREKTTSQIRNQKSVEGFRQKIKNENHMTILVESSNFCTNLRFVMNSPDIYRGESRMPVTSR